MPVNWGQIQRTPTNRLNIQPAIQNYFAAQQNKRQQNLANLTLTTLEQAAEKKVALRDIQMKNIGNPQGLIQGYAQAGFHDEAQAAKTQLLEQQDAQRKRQQEEFKFRTDQSNRLGELSRIVTTSKNPAQAFKNFQNSVIDEKLPVNRAMTEYQVTDEDTMLDPGLVSELNFMGQSGDKTGMKARVRTVYANGLVWLQDQDGNIEPARDPKTGKQLAQSETFKSVASDDEIFILGSKSGDLKGTGIKPKGRQKEVAQIAKTYQDIELDKAKGDRDRELFKAKKLEIAKKSRAYTRKNAEALASVQTFIDRAKAVRRNPNMKYVTGNIFLQQGRRIPNTAAANLQADIDFLVSSGIIETMATLKDTSANGSTGFGSLQKAEMKVMENSFSMLANTNISVKKKQQELDRVLEIMERRAEEQRVWDRSQEEILGPEQTEDELETEGMRKF